MRLWEMGNLTANPRRFFGAFCSVVNMLSETDGRCATATDSRNMTRLEGSDCADTDTLQEAGTGVSNWLHIWRAIKKLKYKTVSNTCECACVRVWSVGWWLIRQIGGFEMSR